MTSGCCRHCQAVLHPESRGLCPGCTHEIPEEARILVLKTWPHPFQATLEGKKPFEIRKDDRGFGVGDWLVLREWDPNRAVSSGDALSYTRRVLRRRVSYVARGWGLPEDLVVLGLEAPEVGS
jgi:hypothetical protein